MAVLFALLVVIGIAISVEKAVRWRRERHEANLNRQIIDHMLFTSGLRHNYRLPGESDGAALDRLAWGAENTRDEPITVDAIEVAQYSAWVEQSGVVDVSDPDCEPTIKSAFNWN